MLTAEKYFCQAMRGLWTVGGKETVACTVSQPDEHWVATAPGPRACVFLSEFELVPKIGDRQKTRVVPGVGDKPDAVTRLLGAVEMVLEVTLATDQESARLNSLAAQLCRAFPLGATFGPEGDGCRFQINRPLRGARVRSAREGPRVTEMVFRLSVRGPFEETGEEYPVETVEQELELR